MSNADIGFFIEACNYCFANIVNFLQLCQYILVNCQTQLRLLGCKELYNNSIFFSICRFLLISHGGCTVTLEIWVTQILLVVFQRLVFVDRVCRATCLR